MEYRRDAKGPAEISDLQNSSGPIAGQTWVCVQFPGIIPGLLGPAEGSRMRRVRIFCSRGILPLGQVSFQRQNMDPWSTCPDEMKPFVELTQFGWRREALTCCSEALHRTPWLTCREAALPILFPAARWSVPQRCSGSNWMVGPGGLEPPTRPL